MGIALHANEEIGITQKSAKKLRLWDDSERMRSSILP
jgi:hypothetical protein